MSIVRGETPDASVLQIHPVEQRARRRYAIRLKIEFTVNKKGLIERGSGKTLNISSGGVLFETKRTLPAEGRIELLLNWPILLDGTEGCPLGLVMWGRIVRSDDKGVAIRFTQHEFRTLSRRGSSGQLASTLWS